MIQVNEIFDAYFNVRKHGIIRNIPLKYTIDGKKFRIFLENIKVDWTNFSAYETHGEKEIKIWDADRELIGDQRYSIHYSVYGLIRNFAGKWWEELSWNIIPNGFDTHIDQVRVELNLPKVYTWFTAEDFLIAADGKSNKLEDFEGTIDWSQGNKIILTYDKTIPAGNGITLAVKFPVGYFTFDHERQESLIDKGGISDKIKDILWIDDFDRGLIPPICLGLGIWFLLYFFIVLFINQFRRRHYFQSVEKSLSEKFPIIIQYDTPKELLPPEVWFLADDCTTSTKQISSLFYKRLNEKVIDIRYDSEDDTIMLMKLSDIPFNEWHYYERWFLNHFFTSNVIVISKNRNFYDLFSGAKQSLSYSCRKIWLIHQTKGSKDYDENIQLISNSRLYLIIGCLVIIGFFYCYSDNSLNSIPVFLFVLFSLSLFSTLIPWNYPSITEKGMQYKNHILWYKQFLETVDVPVLEKFLQQDPLYFDKIMPYAVALWLDTFLIKKFEPLLKKMNLPTPVVSKEIFSINDILCALANNSSKNPHDSSSSSYDRDSWFSSWSSRDSGSSSWSSWGGWWWGGGRSW